MAGQEHLLGYNMAIDEINAAGGILGCPVELVIKDDSSILSQAQLAVKDLVEQDHVLAIMGANSSGTTLAVSGVTEVYQVPFLVPSSSSDLITDQGYEWVFRINAASSAYASTALEFAQQELNTNARLAIVYQSSLFGESAAVAAATIAAEREMTVVAYEIFETGSGDHKPLLTRVKAANPDVIYFATTSGKDAVLLMEQCEELALNPKLYLASAGAFVSSNFLEVGRHAEYVIATSQWAVDVNWPGVTEFTQKFLALYSDTPRMRSAQTYIASYVVKDAIERAAKDPIDWKNISQVRLAVRNALTETNMKETLFGPIAFDDAGQNDHQVLLTQIIDGRFVTVYPRENQTRPAIIPAPSWTER